MAEKSSSYPFIYVFFDGSYLLNLGEEIMKKRNLFRTIVIFPAGFLAAVTLQSDFTGIQNALAGSVQLHPPGSE